MIATSRSQIAVQNLGLKMERIGRANAPRPSGRGPLSIISVIVFLIFLALPVRGQSDDVTSKTVEDLRNMSVYGRNLFRDHSWSFSIPIRVCKPRS
jgi:hypothetical protein